MFLLFCCVLYTQTFNTLTKWFRMHLITWKSRYCHGYFHAMFLMNLLLVALIFMRNCNVFLFGCSFYGKKKKNKKENGCFDKTLQKQHKWNHNGVTNTVCGLHFDEGSCWRHTLFVHVCIAINQFKMHLT